MTEDFKKSPYELNESSFSEVGPKLYDKILSSYEKRKKYNFDLNVVDLFSE